METDGADIIGIIGVLVTLIITFGAGLIAWGRIMEKIRSYSNSIEGCHIEDLRTDKQCKDLTEKCGNHLDTIFDSINEKIATMKADTKEDLKEIKDELLREINRRDRISDQNSTTLIEIKGMLTTLTNGVRGGN